MLDFISKFTNAKIEFIKINSKYFLKDDFLTKEKLPVKEKYFGLFLGEDVNDQFVPSFGLLDWLSTRSKEKVFVKDIGEMDFLYGKPLRSRHVDHVEGETKIGFLKLIQNLNDENLGYGKIVGDFTKTEQVIKPKLDRGLFLKREKLFNKK
jgi:ribosome biogenesis protein Nip4